MFSKIAFKNTLRSIRDYAVYFFTMTLGVCLFYMFNSVSDQQAMMILTESQKENVRMITEILGYVSVFVSVILGFLILYANQFLIRRRKKEMGIYMTLGMSRFRISVMLVTETLLIGIFSLLIGIVLGVFGGQALSVFTAHMFEANLSSFHFIFSREACLKTVFYFGVIFLVVMFFNTFSVSRFKLIDLIYADKQNEKFRAKRLWISVVVFLLSLACLLIAYRGVLQNGLFDESILIWIILGIIGTVFFFFSLSGFLLRLIQAGKKHYYKNLNMFVLRQINSRINTAFLSISVICLMLFVTICTLAGGMSISNVIASENDVNLPYDASFISYPSEDGEFVDDIAAGLAEKGAPLDAYTKSYKQMDVYSSEITYSSMIHGVVEMEELSEDIQSLFSEEGFDLRAVSLTDYNLAMELCGRDPIALAENQYALVTPQAADWNEMGNLALKVIESGKTLKIGEKSYTPAEEALSENYICNQSFMGKWLLILPDKAVENMEICNRILNVAYKDAENEETYREGMIETLSENMEPGDLSLYDMYISRREILDNTVGVRVAVLFLTLYVGIVFLIASAAILALQQLSDVSDSVGRYTLLQKLGAESSMVNRALMSQTAIYFFIPLLLALVHSVIGLTVVNHDFSSMMMGREMLNGGAFAAIVFLFVYGGYFILACLGSRAMLRRNRRQ